MKVTKNELKSIVKECLVEILSEGIGGTQKVEQKARPVQQSSIAENIRRTLSHPPTPQRRPPAPSSLLKEAIRRESGGDNVMADILADTAASTLPMMMQNEGKMPIPSTAAGGVAERVVAAADPEELFGDAASKWASLAFMDSPTKK